MDETLIKYAFWFGTSIKAEKLYFIYCLPESGLSMDNLIKEDKQELPFIEKIKGQMIKSIEKNKLKIDLEYDIIIDQTKPLKGLLYWQEFRKTSLVIIGKKKLSAGTGVISRQFVRMSTCPVLFVPEKVKREIKNILIPVDFSENAQYALELGIKLQPYFEHPKINCLNVYFAPTNFYGGLQSKASNLMRKNAVVEKFNKFIKPYEKNKRIKLDLIAGDDTSITSIINKIVDENKCNLIIIGAIGHSKIKLLMVGSTAEKMMLSEFKVPLLIISS
jgi:nucleotide-binding universal stress UspA family protein